MKRLLIIVIIAASLNVVAQNNNALADSANSAYNRGDYRRSIELYNQILSNGSESSELYYNLGNSFFKTNEIASAVYSYEKALKLDPSNADIKYNLAVAYNRTSDKIESMPEIFYIRWWNALTNTMSANGWAIWAIVASLILFTLIGLFLLSNVRSVKKYGFWGAVVMLFIVIISITIASNQAAKLNNSNEGIIFENTIIVKSAPDDNSTDLFVLHEGTKVFVEDTVGEWFKVKIGNGSTGWLPKTSIKII